MSRAVAGPSPLHSAGSQAGDQQRCTIQTNTTTGTSWIVTAANSTGPEGGPLQVEPTHKIDIEALEPEQRDQLREILLAAKALGIKAV